MSESHCGNCVALDRALTLSVSLSLLICHMGNGI